MARRACIPFADGGPRVELHADDLARRFEDRLVHAVDVDVGQPSRSRRSTGGRGDGVAPQVLVREVLGGDQVLEGREAHVADVDAAEQAVPVAVVRLALVEVVPGTLLRGAGRHCRDLEGRPEHLLVEVVDLAVATLEVAPEPAAQELRLGQVPRLRLRQQFLELDRVVGREHPLGHLGVGARRQVDPADGPMGVRPVGRRQRGQPVGVLLERREERLHPLPGAPAVIPRRRPCPELLAVVAHRPDAAAVGRRVRTQVLDDLGHRLEGDEVAQALLRREHRQPPTLVVGRVGAPVLLVGDGGCAQVDIVDDRPLEPAVDEAGGQVGLPDTLGQPRAARPGTEPSLELIAHPRELADPVGLRERRQHRLVHAAAEDLDLPPIDEPAHVVKEVGVLQVEPLQEGSRVVEAASDRRVTQEQVDHRPVGLLVHVLEHPAEVADRLVVVERQGERDPGRLRTARHGITALGGRRSGRRPDQVLRVASVAAEDRRVRGPAVASAATTRWVLAGMYISSTYSWSMRVVENRQIVLAIERRMRSIHAAGRPSRPRS